MNEITADLLTALADLQTMNRKQLAGELAELNTDDMRMLKQQLLRLSRLLELDSEPYIGKKVSGGYISGIKSKQGTPVRVLVDGTDLHEWRNVEDMMQG